MLKFGDSTPEREKEGSGKVIARLVHPELKPGEAFIGNMTGKKFDDLSRVLKSARRGRVAFDEEGKPIRKNCPGWRKLYPVFASQAEKELYEKDLYDRLWSKEVGK